MNYGPSINGSWSDDLQCNIISHKIKSDSVSLYLPEYDEPDMSGSIRLAKSLNSDVSRIYIFNGNKRSPGYSICQKSRQWIAESCIE